MISNISLELKLLDEEKEFFWHNESMSLTSWKILGMLECKLGVIPIDVNHKNGATWCTTINKEGYHRLVGKLIYLSHTIPHIQFVASVVSQFLNASTEHMNVVVKIQRYLKGIIGKGLIFTKKSHLEVEAYSNADWAASIYDIKSASRYYTFVGGNLVNCRSKKQ